MGHHKNVGARGLPSIRAQLMRAIMFMAHAFPGRRHPQLLNLEVLQVRQCIIFIAVPVAKVNFQVEITRTCKSFTFDVTSVGNNCCGIIRLIAKFYVHIIHD